jgi:hypothetical protein
MASLAFPEEPPIADTIPLTANEWRLKEELEKRFSSYAKNRQRNKR